MQKSVQLNWITTNDEFIVKKRIGVFELQTVLLIICTWLLALFLNFFIIIFFVDNLLISPVLLCSVNLNVWKTLE